jgi:hypothetical protein
MGQFPYGGLGIGFGGWTGCLAAGPASGCAEFLFGAEASVPDKKSRQSSVISSFFCIFPRGQ